MTAGVVGLVTLIAGALFCFRGGAALRALLAVWGGFVGFVLGAEVAASVTGEQPFTGPGGWIGALLGALVLGSLAYAFYALAVVLSVGSMGFSLGALLAAILGAPDPWAGVVGLAAAIGLAVVALATELPRLLLTVFAAVVGAVAMVGALLLLFGRLGVGQLTPGGVWDAVAASPWWAAAVVVLAVLGTIVQSRRPAVADQRWGPRASRTPGAPPRTPEGH